MSDPFATVEDGSSLSGHERNVLFLSREGRQFENVSGISGADDPADGRAVGLLDYDRDGWQDLVVVNANAPQVQLFRNQIAARAGSGAEGGFIAIQLEGGRRGREGGEGLSNRDGVGARVEVEVGGQTRVRTRRAGEGFASQNSATFLVGVGAAQAVDGITVRWPSGRVQRHGPVPAGSRVRVREARGDAADAFAIADYAVEGLAARSGAEAAVPTPRGVSLTAGRAGGSGAPLRLVTTMATWCESCKGELPQLEALREAFSAEQLALLGVPIDEDDSPEKLAAYQQEYRPAYQLLTDLSEPQIEEVRQTVLRDLRIDALPATIATDAEGRVVRTLWDVPSVSEVRELLKRVSR